MNTTDCFISFYLKNHAGFSFPDAAMAEQKFWALTKRPLDNKHNLLNTRNAARELRELTRQSAGYFPIIIIIMVSFGDEKKDVPVAHCFGNSWPCTKKIKLGRTICYSAIPFSSFSSSWIKASGYHSFLIPGRAFNALEKPRYFPMVYLTKPSRQGKLIISFLPLKAVG